MSRLTRIITKKTDKVVEYDGEKFEIPVLNASQLSSFFLAGSTKPADQAQGMLEIAKFIVKYNIPDVTQEEINSLPLPFIMDLVEAIEEQIPKK